MTSTEGRLLSVQDTADFLGIHKNTLDNWHSNGYGPPRYKIGGRIVYRYTEVDSWISGQVQK